MVRGTTPSSGDGRLRLVTASRLGERRRLPLAAVGRAAHNAELTVRAVAGDRRSEVDMALELGHTAEAMADVLAAATLEELSDRYHGEVADHVPSFAQGVYLHPDGRDRPSFIDVRGLGSFYTHQYEKHGRPTDPVVQAAIATGRVIDSSLISYDEWQRSDADEVFRSHRMGHLLCAPFEIGGEFAGTLNLARHPDERGFDADDRRRMSMVAALFASGVAACRRLETAQRDADVFRSALDHCGIPLVVTDLRAVEQTLNASARRLVDAHVDAWSTLGAAVDGAVDTTVTLSAPHGDRTEVRVSHVPLPIESVTLAILHLTHPDVGVVPDDVAATLTPRETEVAAAVAAGLSDVEVASALHLSRHTVRHHLKAVYRKLDVHSRVELVRRLQRR